MAGKQLDQWGANEDYYYNDYYPSQELEIQPTTGLVYLSPADNQASSYENSWRAHDRDRQTGSYTTATTKEAASRGETFKERSTGRVGSKDEYKTTSTYRVGDRSGYTEYQCQERYRTVDYSSSSGSGSRGSGSSGSGSRIKGSTYSTSKNYLK